MEVCKQQNPQYFHGEEEDIDYEDYSENGGFDSDSDYDCDSDMDSSYCIVEGTRRQLSDLSIKKKSISRICKELDEGFEKEPDRVDEKSFEEVEKIIQAGGIEKLKVEQCKMYLRKNGLRLTGNKETLLLRIKEHQEILKGEGEKKYPVSSFVLNCKGDACTGDIVMFEQNVYEMFSIASRSASGPPLGTRIIVGRIVKESYGAAKQQHTFTIEVLWSKGEKPLPPLHPLLIKGRNLYRLKTLRQKWEDEGERQKVLMDKHSRGSLARCARESRIQDKQMRKSLRENKGLKKERNGNQPKLKTSQQIQPQHPCFPVDSGKSAPKLPGLYMESGMMTSRTENYGSHKNAAKQTIEASNPRKHHLVNMNRDVTSEKGFAERYHHRQPLTSMNKYHPVVPQNKNHSTFRVNRFEERYQDRSGLFIDLDTITHQRQNYGSYMNVAAKQTTEAPNRAKHLNGLAERYYRQPLTALDDLHQITPLNRQSNKQQKQCKFYAQERCFYGDNCKFSHK